ncbi:DALR anticodon-binding domain-containing protein [Limnofasciculus baicalensis]|uniref:DALR anticodon-binding domain-containing protein n=1 Tax=Limnofasciculus baicalensis BBK-W-15 TaxID=2699891 RepID=A0AAE3KQ88_9CYAN|nr:DALR anticodon-binding domain-containing protein [Limnofasciculus baicalensis]MCP2732194.1 DALR anticodon-binding domain-containing protein [Limnofasciculus baicalensis BBK-W-15]
MEYKVAKNTSNCRKFTVRGGGNSGLKPLLQQLLGETIGLFGRTQLNPKTISIHRLLHRNSVIYRSAIALKLSPLWQLPPDDIAHQLTAALLTMPQDTIAIDFMVEVVSPGWIDFQLGDRSLATVLQQLIEIPLSPSTPGNCLFSKDYNLFPIQYTHARCSSLLRLGGSGTADAVSGGGEEGSREWNSGCRIGGVEKFFPDREGERLGFVHLAEWDLIFQILDLLDVMSDSDQRSLVKRGFALCHAFDAFHRSCRIWGEVKIHQPQLTKARLGLVKVTQILLRSLLEDCFGVPALLEL